MAYLIGGGVVVCLVITVTKAALLEISQSKNPRTGSPTLTLRCSPTNTNYTLLYSLQILKTPPVPPGKLAIINAGGTQYENTTATSYNVSGEFYPSREAGGSSLPLTKSYLQVVLTDPPCGKAIEYRCISNGESVGSDDIVTDSRNYTVEKKPSDIVISIKPNKATYEIKETVEIECTGKVGNPQKTWSWQWKFRHTNAWVYYGYYSDMSNGPVHPPTETECSYVSSTKLTHRIRPDDHGRSFRCVVAFNPYDYKAELTIYLTNRTTPSTTTQTTTTASPATSGSSSSPNVLPNSSDDNGDSELSEGGIIGIVLTVIVLLASGVVLALILKKRKDKRNGDSQQSLPHPRGDNAMVNVENIDHPAVVNKAMTDHHDVTQIPTNLSTMNSHDLTMEGLDDSGSEEEDRQDLINSLRR